MSRQEKPLDSRTCHPSVRTVSAALALLTAATMATAINASTAAAAPQEPPPPADAFYNQPSDLASWSPGDVIRSRPVEVKALQLLPLNVQGWQLLYRTTGMDGAPEATVTTVIIPEGPAKPRPLLSYQAATDSTLRVCGPSYTLTEGSPIDFGAPTGPLTISLPAAEIALAAAGLYQGWAVSMPDHGGANDRFLTPHQPGFAVLDGIRAAESFNPLMLAGVETPVALWGYSGGAIASSWAIEEQPTYAPELNIKGAAFGAPERDLEASLLAVNRTPLAGLIPVALSSIGKDSPEFELELDKYLTPQGKALVDRTRNHCAGQNVLSNLWFRYEPYLNEPISTVLSNPVVRREIDARGVTGRAPTAPAYVYNGVTEEVAPISGTDKLVDSYCVGGAPVTYRREALPPNPIPQISSTHAIVLATGAPGAFEWIKGRLADNAPTLTGCDIQTVPSTLDTDGIKAFGPPFLGALIAAATGTPIGR